MYYEQVTNIFTQGIQVFHNVPPNTKGILILFFICFMIFIVFRLHEYIGLLATIILWIFYTISIFIVSYYAIQYIHFLSDKLNPEIDTLPAIIEPTEEPIPQGILPPETFWTDVTEHIQFTSVLGDEIHHPRGFPIRKTYPLTV